MSGRGLVVDLFAGGGGASAGIEAALGRRVDIAINHDPVAMAVHKANHPGAVHLEADIWEVRPKDATKGRPVDVLWASPDCTHFSVAKGGKPRKQKIRSLAWAVVRWAAAVRPSVIFLENVAEFRSWGPLGEDGRPQRRRMGATFLRWRGKLERLGYVVDHRVLDASHYGAPTRRRRLFIVARCDGRPIRWPVPTHGTGPGLLPLRTAAECIDWSLPCPSIFEREKPLAEKTLWRIAQGIRRFVLENQAPFIGTVVAGGRKHALVSAFIAKHFGGVVGSAAERPVDTITARDHNALTAATLPRFNYDDAGVPLDEPLPTVTAGAGHIAEGRAFLTAFYGSDGTAGKGQSLREPARTLTAKHRLGLVTVEGVDFQIVDIGMRMLEPHELLAAQFGRFAGGYDLSPAKTKAAKVRLIGNSVCPEAAEAIVRENLPAAPAETERVA